MLNLTMPILHKIPLAYTGRLLVGIATAHHHGQNIIFNPFRGYVVFNRTPRCGVGRLMRAFINEDQINGNNEGKWINYEEGISANSVFYSKLDPQLYKGIDVVKETDPDVNNPKYWTIGYAENIRVLVFTDLNDPMIINSDSCYSYQTGKVIRYPHSEAVYYTAHLYTKYPYTEPKKLIENQIPLAHYSRFIEFNSNNEIILGLPGHPDMYFYTFEFIFNFNIKMYKNDHPELGII